MATQTIPQTRADAEDRPAARSIAPDSPLARTLEPLASLKLTVVLFALAIVLVLASTLAQHRKGMWQVISQYYSTPLAYIEFQDLLPTSFTMSLLETYPQVRGGFYFPGGALIGGLMALNLLAAHALRFRVRVRGAGLILGLSVLGVGVLATWLVIASGSNKDGFQHAASIEWPTLWKFVKIGTGALFLSALYGTLYLFHRGRTPGWWRGLCVLGTIGLGGLFFFVLQTKPLSDSAMRILWQLAKAQIAATVLLAGCIPLFGRRAGIVLLHAGVGLMLTQLFVGVGVSEAQMHIEEEQTVNYAQDIRAVELAVIDPAPEERYETAYVPQWIESEGRPLREVADNVTVVPGSLLAPGRRLSDERLPFDLEVIEFMPSSNLRDIPESGRKTPATAGAGLRFYAEPAARSTGTDSRVDVASAYVRFFDKNGQALGTWLVSQHLKPQPVRVGGKTYEIDLRFKRDYKQYAVTLLDIQKRDYIGTTTPMDYSSYIVLRDPPRNVERELRIWMNNPLRYAGETFYQSSYHPPQPQMQTDPVTGQQRPVLETDPATGQRRPKMVEATTLQVVANTGWMVPYVACMIVLTGMLAHFTIVLLRFLNRRAVEEGAVATATATAHAAQTNRPPESPQVKAARRAAKAAGAPGIRKLDRSELEAEGPNGGLAEWETIAAWTLPVVLVVLGAGYALGKLSPPKPTAAGMQIHEFGRLPIVDRGRAKPFDSLARNSLQQISGRETFVGRMDAGRLRERWDDIRGGLVRSWSELSEADFSDFTKRLDSVPDASSGRDTRDESHRPENPHRFAADLVAMIAERTGKDRGEVAARVDELTMEKQPAIRWLLDTIAKPRESFEHRVVRIENLDVLSSLGLERRPGYRYAISEFQDKMDKIGEQAQQARELREESGAEALDTFQRKILELENKIGVVVVLSQSFGTPEISTEEPLADLQFALREQQRLARQQPPLVVPPSADDDDENWQTFTMGWLKAWVQRHAAGRDADPAFAALARSIAAYAVDDAEKFNAAIEEYWTAIKASPPADLNVTRTGFEAFYNRFAPLFSSIWLYLAAFLLAAFGWLGWSRPLNRAALWLILFTFLVHSFGLVARIYISGRPPVTNLYSSAVFIAWGTVLLGLIVEMIYRRGIGNVIAAVSGFGSLLIAWSLSVDGDTFTVLQAVLDTQFWLATHVTFITFGYAATLVAGLLGLVYVLRGSRPAPLVVGLGLAALALYFFMGSKWEYATLAGAFSGLAAVACLGAGTMMLTGALQPDFPAEDRRSLTRMTYGTLCFAIFFSFVGTVLGGLWADDSWGRFWGWDPKENGALMIVLWIALVLHARWDGWVKDRGLAVLAIGGNIVTSWSWFGVNELGVGLHSYGFTDGVLLTLGLFWLSQFAVIGLGCLPRSLWWNQQESGRAIA